MKIVTHKFRLKEDQTCYLVNLVDQSGHPLKSHVAMNNKENNQQLVDRYVDELNDLWDKASVEMLKNAEKYGDYTPDKS